MKVKIAKTNSDNYMHYCDICKESKQIRYTVYIMGFVAADERPGPSILLTCSEICAEMAMWKILSYE